MTNQVSPLGAPDFSSLPAEHRQLRRRPLINVNWGHDAVLSIQQAKQFGVLDKMKLVVPYQVPFLARETGGLMQGVYAATDYWWTIEDKYPLAKHVRRRVREEVRLQAGVGRRTPATCSFADWARMVETAGTFYPPAVIKAYEKGEKIQSLVGDVHFRPEDHQLRPPGHHRAGKKADGHEGQGGLLRRRRDRAGRAADAEAGRVRLQARRLHLIVLRRDWESALFTWANFVSQMFNGLVLGALLALISSGLTIIYGTLGVLNLAHGAMFMIGGYAGYVTFDGDGIVHRSPSLGGALFVLVVGIVHGAGRSSATSTPAARGPDPGDVRPVDRLRRGDALLFGSLS